MMQEIWVIWWRYNDGSAAGVLRAYANEQRANEDLDLLNIGYDKDYKIEKVPVYT
jgi:hypothetical protein